MSCKNGTQTDYAIARAGKSGYVWQKDDLEKLRAMIERHASQEEIMRAFPDHTWRTIRERYRYHYGTDKLLYTLDELTYPKDTRWTDVEAHQRQTQHTLITMSTTGQC